MKTTFDAIDLLILALLQLNGRIPNAELAKKVNLSAPSVLVRVRALESGGFIRGYHAVLDPERLGLKLTAFAMISLSLHQEQGIERFRRAVQAIPEVVECYNVSGEYDFLLKVQVKDIRAYEALIRERLSKIKGIRQINTSFVLATDKLSPNLPLPTDPE